MIRDGEMMTNIVKTLLVGAVVIIAAGGAVSIAYAQQQPPAPATPNGWNYEIRDGKRVPKGQRVKQADGSWREEIRQGNCVTVKERSAQGDYRETRQCDPKPE